MKTVLKNHDEKQGLQSSIIYIHGLCYQSVRWSAHSCTAILLLAVHRSQLEAGDDSPAVRAQYWREGMALCKVPRTAQAQPVAALQQLQVGGLVETHRAGVVVVRTAVPRRPAAAARLVNRTPVAAIFPVAVIATIVIRRCVALAERVRDARRGGAVLEGAAGTPQDGDYLRDEQAQSWSNESLGPGNAC